MISTTRATQATVAQTVATASTSGLGVTNVGVSSAELATVRLNVATTVVYPPDAFPNGSSRCQPVYVLDGYGGQTIQVCRVLPKVRRHSHETKIVRNFMPSYAKPTDNPIPIGATKFFYSYAYVDSTLLATEQRSVQLTRSTFYESNYKRCADCYCPLDDVVATCSVQSKLHCHTTQKQIAMSPSENLIPERALSFSQHFSYAMQRHALTASVEFCTVDREDLPVGYEYSRNIVFANLVQDGQANFKDWRIPHGWDYLHKNSRARFVQMIVNCYMKGASLSSITGYLGLKDMRNTRGLLLLKVPLSQLRSAMQQRDIESKNRDAGVDPMEELIQSKGPRLIDLLGKVSPSKPKTSAKVMLK